MSETNPNIVVIGGGTGSFTILSGLKRFSKNISALVSMADDGGSTGLLRDEFGVLPPGDVRQCLVALSESPDELRELFNYRFPYKTSLAGHSFGNLFLTALEMMSSDFARGIKIASDVLKIKGKVIPITLVKTKLHLASDGGEVIGQHKIANLPFMANEKPDLWLVPKSIINPEAKLAIENADLVVIAPGDLYGSLLPALLVDGVPGALQKTSARVVYICNLVNKPHQTKDFGVNDYVRELGRFIGYDTINTVIYNQDKPDDILLKTYALEGEIPVNVDENLLDSLSYQAIGGDLLSHKAHYKNPNDNMIKRSLIRHDPEAVSKILIELLSES